MQRAEQEHEQPTRQRGRPFPPGTSGNPRGAALTRERVATLMRELAADLGGLSNLSAGDRTLLERAASLLAVTPSRHEDRVRGINAAGRILAGLRKRRSKRDVTVGERGPPLAELLARRVPPRSAPVATAKPQPPAPPPYKPRRFPKN